MFGKHPKSDQSCTADNMTNLERGPILKLSQIEVADLERLAADLLQALAFYNTIEPELEQEIQHSGGWLKVQKLKSMAGKAMPVTQSTQIGKRRTQNTAESSLSS